MTRRMIKIVAALTTILFSAGAALAVERPRTGAEMLLHTYQSNIAKLEKNSYGIPLFLDSVEQDDKVKVDVYGIFDHPFGTVSRVLKDPVNWCDIVSLTPNVKACTSGSQEGVPQLTLYLGNKTYQPPEESRHQLRYQYRKLDQQQAYLDIALGADSGPFATRDHTIRFEAVPLEGGSTFAHVSFSYRDSVALRLAGKAYFATLGRNKAGFTITGTDSKGHPVYIGGARGALERNAIRNYFAIRSFIDTLGYSETSRLDMRTNEWYDLTSRYPKQLDDLDRKDYLTFKAKEHRNQVTLQRQLNNKVILR